VKIKTEFTMSCSRYPYLAIRYSSPVAMAENSFTVFNEDCILFSAKAPRYFTVSD